MSENKIYKKFKFILPIWALICAVLSAAAFKYAFDKEVGYFATSPLTYAFYASILLAIAASIVAAVLHTPTAESNNESNRRTMAIIMLCAFTFYLVSFMFTKRPVYLKAPMFALVIFFGFISIIHFAIISFAKNPGSSAKILTGLAPVLTSILIATISYFDHTETLNSPYKLLFEFGCIAFALYYITELRNYTDAPRKKLVVATSGICITLTLCAGVAKMFEIMYSSAPTLINISSAILFAAMASCSASKLLEP